MNTTENQNDVAVSYGTQINNKNERMTLEPFSNVIARIRTGSDNLNNITAHLRTLPDEARKAYKRDNFPYFIPAIFTDNHRLKSNFIRTQSLVLDFDHVDQLTEKREQLIKDERVYLLFISPSGDGLKVVCNLDQPITECEKYKSVYTYYAEEFKKKYGLPWDPKGKSVAQTCFLAYDPDVYLNVDAVALSTDVVIVTHTKGSKRTELLSAISNGATVGERTHTAVQLASILMERGIDKDFTFELLKPWNELCNKKPLPEDKLLYTIEDINKRYSSVSNQALLNYWSYGTDILEIGIIDSKYYMEKNAEKKVYARTGAYSDEAKTKVYSYLARDKHIPHLAKINFLGDISVSCSYYEYINQKAVIDVHYQAIPIQEQDNQFIEDYLLNVFGQYKTFIKEWMAVYCYTNHTKLPFLVITGKRGSGKNTFAETLGEIYPSISTMWHGVEKNFNPECEMKLLIADETISNDMEQYRTLKKYSGQQYTVVNHKYLKPYKVINNMNVIILSNSKTPISVERDEIPDCEENNQFFVFQMKPVNGSIDTSLREKLVERLGYYIRTELLNVFNNLKMNGNRYSVKTPITPEERALFINNGTTADFVVELYIQKLVSRYEDSSDAVLCSFVDKKYLPTGFFEGYTIKDGISRSDLIKRMVEKGYLESAEYDRKKIDGNREYVYQITDKMFSEVTKGSVPTVCLQNTDDLGTINGVSD
jgi:energy-coupling factor transporter ATP-binding protein EcfA2